MKLYLRRSIFTKAAALGFIVMILLGNAWLVQALTGQKVAVWMAYSFAVCIVWTSLAGCGMGLKIIQHQFHRDSDDDAPI